MLISELQAREIMGKGLIGAHEINSTGLFKEIEETFIPKIPFSVRELEKKKDDYLLILGVDKLLSGEQVTIRNLLKIFGKDPNTKEPCFYNQDWYEKEDFIDIPMKNEWFIIRKEVFEDSRAIQPGELLKKYQFPLAITCTYAFFVSWLCFGLKLWYHDFVWCSDTDHNGDRIYVGKYNDIDGVNKNGFSIHRHLALRQCYACIE